MSGLDELLLRMPKVELHVHFEGSMPPATLLELAKRRRVDLPTNSLAGLNEWFQFRDFGHFVQIYLTICKCLREPEDFQLLLDAIAAEQARQNVFYSEVHFTVGTHLMNGISASELRDAMAEGLVAAEKRHGVRLRLIPDIVRNVPFVNTIRRHHKAHHNMGIMMHVNMNLTFPVADWAMGTSDLDRGLLGHIFNGYSDKHVKEELKPIIARFRNAKVEEERVTLEGPQLNDEEKQVLAKAA